MPLAVAVPRRRDCRRRLRGQLSSGSLSLTWSMAAPRADWDLAQPETRAMVMRCPHRARQAWKNVNQRTGRSNREETIAAFVQAREVLG